ncbi:MAG: hypothetical protein PUF49_08525 [Firmicutes bacterium]|nr:hypothetical protein [Bacillota bacterium]
MNTEDLIAEACSLFGEPYDDRASSTSLFLSPHGQKPEHTSLRSVAEEMEISVVKVRKLLISGGVYSTATSRRVQELYDKARAAYLKKGECPAQAEKFAVIKVCQQTHLGRASVYSYLPFKNEAYGLEKKSVAAIRQRRYRERKKKGTSEKPHN